MSRNKPDNRGKTTQWFLIEPVGAGSKGFLRFALQEAQKAKRWVWEVLDTKQGLPEGDLEWHAKQFRRRYLTGKPALHTVPGYIFERAILDGLRTWELIERENHPTWLTVYLPPRKGWSGERSGEAVVQKFSFTGEPRAVVRNTRADVRAVTPEKAEAEWFDEGILSWKWGSLRTGTDVGKAVDTLMRTRRIPIRRREDFFSLVEEVEVAQVKSREVGRAEQWKMRLVLRG